MWIYKFVSLRVSEFKSWWVLELVSWWVDVFGSRWAFVNSYTSELVFRALRIWDGCLSCVGITKTINSAQFIKYLKPRRPHCLRKTNTINRNSAITNFQKQSIREVFIWHLKYDQRVNYLRVLSISFGKMKADFSNNRFGINSQQALQTKRC